MLLIMLLIFLTFIFELILSLQPSRGSYHIYPSSLPSLHSYKYCWIFHFREETGEAPRSQRSGQTWKLGERKKLEFLTLDFNWLFQPGLECHNKQDFFKRLPEFRHHVGGDDFCWHAVSFPHTGNYWPMHRWSRSISLI